MATIQIALNNGEKTEIEAEVIGNFAIHKMLGFDKRLELWEKADPLIKIIFAKPKPFTVTAVKSGLGLADFPTEEAARFVIEKLNASPLDWGVDINALDESTSEKYNAAFTAILDQAEEVFDLE